MTTKKSKPTPKKTAPKKAAVKKNALTKKTTAKPRPKPSAKHAQKPVEHKTATPPGDNCPECGSTSLGFDPRRAEKTCNKCGLVVEDRQIDTSQEWRAFDHEQRQKRDRTGSFLTYTRHDKGLSTSIGDHGYSDLYKLAPSKRASFYRMRKWHSQVSTATERNLRYALSELDRISSALGLPKNIRETTALVYRKAVTKGLVRGRSMESVVAAALYAACRKHNVPRTLDEIAEGSNVKKREVGRTYRFITRELGMKLLPTSPVDYVSRFASELKLSPKVQEKAIEILKTAQTKDLVSGRGPTGVAAASIYVASTLSGEKRTQREVAEVAGVTEVTIRNRYKELIEELGIEDKMAEAI
ncbi:MAG: transcription initiation factor IIB [archaeon]